MLGAALQAAGLVSNLIGKKNKGSSSSSESGTRDTNETSKRTINTNSQTDGTSSERQSLFGAEDLGLLQQRLREISTSGSTNALGALTGGRDFANMLGNLDPEALAQSRAMANKNLAELTYKRQIEPAINDMSGQIGSSLNSFTALTRERGAEDLATQLASIDAEAAMNAQNQRASNLGQAATILQNLGGQFTSSESQGINDQARLFEILKGGQSTTAGQTSETQRSSTIEDLVRKINEVTSGTSTGKTNEAGLQFDIGNVVKQAVESGTKTPKK